MPRRGENIRKRKDNRWEGRYIRFYDEQGKAYYGSVYAKSYLEVKKKLLFVSKQAGNKLEGKNAGNYSFQEILFLWLQNIQIKIKPQTYAKYNHIIEKHIIPFIGNIKVNKVSSILIHKFVAQKKENGRLDQKGGLSESSLRTLIYIIKASLSFASAKGFCPALQGEVISFSVKGREINILNKKEQQQLELYLCNNLNASTMGILLCLYTGLRVGEICALRWNDIDWHMGVLYVRRTIQRVKNLHKNSFQPKTMLTSGEPKTPSSNRKIPIPSFLIPLLKKQKDQAEKNSYVLTGRGDYFLEPRTYQYRFKTYLHSAGLQNIINFHALRHTFATRCIEAGFDAKTLSELLGHSSVNITLNRYVHSLVEQKRAQMELLSLNWGHE